MESKFKSTISVFPPSVRNTLHHDSQYMMQRIASLESQLAKLIALIEENNHLIKSMEQ
ncbi:hypothetical protein J0804_13460 [Bacillus mobilis]|uniref:hypothetical protein n=1 Tax=Bacillus mobilis TaxID=2026190 RepID=UPI002FDC045E